MKIICSSDEEDEIEIAIPDLTVAPLELETVEIVAEMPLPPTMHYDSSDHSDNEANLQKPTKQDRVYAHQIAQKALRELQFELPQRKSKLNMSKFLSDHGITRDDSMEKLMKRIKKKKVKILGTPSDLAENPAIPLSEKQESAENSQIAITPEELPNIAKTNPEQGSVEYPNVHPSATFKKIEGEDQSLEIIASQQVSVPSDASQANPDIANECLQSQVEEPQEINTQQSNASLNYPEDRTQVNAVKNAEVLEVLKERGDISHLKSFVRTNSSSDDDELAIVLQPASRPGSAKKARRTPFYIQDMETRKIVDINKRLSRLAEKQGVERREKMIELQSQQLEEAKKRKEERKLQRQKDQEEKLKKALEIIAQRKQDEEEQAEKAAKKEAEEKAEILQSDDIEKATNMDFNSDTQLQVDETSLEPEMIPSPESTHPTQAEYYNFNMRSNHIETEQKDEDILDLLSGQFPETQASSNPQQTHTQVVNNWGNSQDNLTDLLSGNFMLTQASSKLRNDISEEISNEFVKIETNSTGITAEASETTIIRCESEIKVTEAAITDIEESSDTLQRKQVPAQQQSRNILDLISESEESEVSDDEGVEGGEDSSSDDEERLETEPLSNPNPVANPLRAILSWNNPFNQPNSKVAIEKQKAAKPGARFVDTEAEVEEDEFMNYGGLEGEDQEGQDQYDLSMLNDDSAEPINLEAVLELHKQQLKLDDEEQVQALINDVTSGAMRKRKSKCVVNQGGKDGSGKGLDMYDSDDETEALLRRIRAQLGVGQSKRDEEFDGSLKSLASNPQTQAFANCFAAPGLEKTGFLSSSDEEEKNIALSAKMARVRNKTGKSRKIARSNSYTSKIKPNATNALPEFSELIDEEFPILPQTTFNGKDILTRINSRKAVVGTFTRASTMVSAGCTQITSRLLSKKSIIENGEENLLQNDNGKAFNKMATGFRAPKQSAQTESKSSPTKRPKKVPREKKATARRLANLIGGNKF